MIQATKSTAPKPRADAVRNRARILDIAKVAFTTSGANASLDDIAKQAGIGPGTLYRHFPTRGALLEAVYRTEVEKLAEAERTLSGSMPPIEALRTWMLLFVDYIATKKIIAPALNALFGDPPKVFADSSSLISNAIDGLVGRAIESGDIRADLDPFDLLRALVGIANVATASNWAESARRLVQILLRGSQPMA